MESEDQSVRLTLNSIREIITNQDPSVEVLDLDEAPGSGRGDNYTSMLYRIKLKGRKLSEQKKWIAWEKFIIYKVLPESKERREAFKSEMLFRNEVIFYTKVWPELQKLQSDGKTVFNGVANIYIAKNNLIAMEDLRVDGFRMADRKKGLEVDKLKLVLKALAGFHALSLTLKELRPDIFAKLSDPESGEGIQEALFKFENQDWYRDYYKVATSNAIKMVSDGLPESMGDRRNEILEKFKDFLNENTFFRTMCELTSTQGPLSVFCHGDCWTNNFLFREESSSNPEAVYLVDFQLTRVGSLALDLANLLYCCTSGEIRRVHMVQLLQHYHHHLMAALYTLNPAGQSTRDPASIWNLLTEEMRRCSRFGLGLAVDMLPISTCTSDQAPDLYEGKDSNEEKHSYRAPPRGGAECTRLMTDLVTELVQCRAL